MLSNAANLAREWYLCFGTLWSFKNLWLVSGRLLKLVNISRPKMNISSEKLFGSLWLGLTYKLFLANLHQLIRFLCCHYTEIRNGLDGRNIVADNMTTSVKVGLWNIELVMRYSLHYSCSYLLKLLVCTTSILYIRAERSSFSLFGLYLIALIILVFC